MIPFNRQAKAVNAFKKANEIDPDDADAHDNFGVAYAEKDDVAVALQENKILLVRDPNKSKQRFEPIYK